MSNYYPNYILPISQTYLSKTDYIQNTSILYHLCCLKGMHYVRTVSTSYQKYIHFFYIMSHVYLSNIPISHWGIALGNRVQKHLQALCHASFQEN